VTTINLSSYEVGEPNRARLNALIARNKRLRHLFLFDARQMLLSLMCADECGVVWPYLLKVDDKDVGVSSDNVETLRAEYAGVVSERAAAADAALVAADAALAAATDVRAAAAAAAANAKNAVDATAATAAAAREAAAAAAAASSEAERRSRWQASTPETTRRRLE
jgi:hypothetical protein